MSIYGPATRSDRYDFNDQLLQHPLFQTLFTNISIADGMHNNYLATFPNAPSIVLGDFNYNFRHYCPLPTVASTDFRSDYLVHSVHSEWTDHTLLFTQLKFANADLAGLCRQDASDQVKAVTRQVAESCIRRQTGWRRRLPSRLQGKRNKQKTNNLHLYKSSQMRNDRLPKIEAVTGHLQQELTDIQALGSCIKWREQGDILAPGFLKRLATQRVQQRAIPTLLHLISTTSWETTSDKHEAAVAFYDRLYTADAVDTDAIRYFTNQIPATDRIPDSYHQTLCELFTLDDLVDTATRAPKQSSSGIDSLPYTIIHLLLIHAATAGQ
ncbi:hypothetical protein [Parasitella parasitica]|uniref:Endonuclease/exonuclease/phosphatase domain-containing protein n=1 Tax=Parasitella parasitica TaxID=35722 RepID=A0A0B7NDX6_9FUNG|nr:hypothetical protein [Parasitella parasitica]